MESIDGVCLTKICPNQAGPKPGPTASMVVKDMDISLDDSEPCTQPLEDAEAISDSQESATMEIDQNQIYGYLLPLKPKGGSMISLDKDVFPVGRSVKTAFQIVNTNDEIRNFEAISKVHFIIRKEARGVTLQDMSSNGTFVNGIKLGKAKTTLLTHNDSIGLFPGKVRHFMFMSTNKDYLRMYPEELRKKYTVSRELGKGACGTVFLGVRKDDHEQVAIKVINKKKTTMVPAAHNVLNEVKLLKEIDHPCIIRLEDVIETDSELYIILELADGGELFDKIIEKTKFREEEAKLCFYQLLSAIEYLHSKNIAHRDLKPENILLCSEDDENPIIKVTDLGLSKFVDVHTHLKTFCGTPQYLAPEVVFSRVRGDGSYDHQVDMWSLGVILYILLCGSPPFNPDRSDKPLVRQVTEGDYSFPSKLWSKISPRAIDLVKKLLTVDPKQRLNATSALQHSWMSDPAVIDKATKLMDSQRRSSNGSVVHQVSCLNGIIPAEWEQRLEQSKPVIKESFKRPMEEDAPSTASTCKRARNKDS